MFVQCVVCGKIIESQKSTKKYCSNKCQNEARKNRIKKSPSKSIDRICLLCGKPFQIKNHSANLRQCCYDCMPEGIQLTRGMFLAKVKQLRGGKCIKCGYSRCLKALEFHHLDPSKKDFTISNDNFKLASALEESKKCILLCSNCHRELHDNLWNIDELNL